MRHAQIERLRRLHADVQRLMGAVPNTGKHAAAQVIKINEILFVLIETLLMEREGMEDIPPPEEKDATQARQPSTDQEGQPAEVDSAT